MDSGVLEILLLSVVEGEEDSKHDGESPEGWTSIAHEWEWYADYWHYADGHADIDEQVHE